MANYSLPVHAARTRVLLLLLLIMLSGCNYYKPIQKTTNTNTEKVTVLQSQLSRIFILHFNDSFLWLDKPQVDVTNETISGVLQQVLSEHTSYINAKEEKYKYKQKEPAVLNEIHIYALQQPDAVVGMAITIKAADIGRIELIERDNKRSNTNTIITAAGITMLVLLVALPIVFPVAQF